MSASQTASPTLYVRGSCSGYAESLTDDMHQLLKAIKKRPGWTKQQIDEDAVLLRAYGKGTDVLIDRESKRKLRDWRSIDMY